MDHRSFVRTARVVASVGLLGASIGGAAAGVIPMIGLATVGAEEIGLLVGVLAGALLVAKHIV